MFFNKRPPSISLPGRGHRQSGAGPGARGGGPGGKGSRASERRGGAGGRGHARQPSREAAAVSNTVAMATWPRGTGSGRNSSRRGPRLPAPPPASPLPRRPARARLRRRPRPPARPLPRMRPGLAPRGRHGGTRRHPDPNGARPPDWVGEKKNQNCWLFAFGKQPRLCPRRIRWLGAEGGEPRGQGHISQRSPVFSERQVRGRVRAAVETRAIDPALP